MLLAVVFFAAVTWVELQTLVAVSREISTVNTISLVMLDFLIGVIISRSWGSETFLKLQWHLKSREIPPDDVVNAVAMTLAGFFFLTPGVVSDFFGILILIPQTRRLFKQMILLLFRSRLESGQPYFFFKD